MSRFRIFVFSSLVAVVGIGMLSVRSASAQSTASSLPDAMRTHLQNEQLTPIAGVAQLPAALQDGLKNLFATPTLRLAEPNAEYQATDVVLKPNLPTRRLIRAGCSVDHCLVYYERGGIAHVWYVVLFTLSENRARFAWGGFAPGGLGDLNAIKDAVLSGAVRAQSGYW